MNRDQADLLKLIVDAYAQTVEVHGRMVAINHIDRDKAFELRQGARANVIKAIDLMIKPELDLGALPRYDLTFEPEVRIAGDREGAYFKITDVMKAVNK